MKIRTVIEHIAFDRDEIAEIEIYTFRSKLRARKCMEDNFNDFLLTYDISKDSPYISRSDNDLEYCDPTSGSFYASYIRETEVL